MEIKDGSVHLDTVKEFFDETREDRIKATAFELWKCVHPKKAKEIITEEDKRRQEEALQNNAEYNSWVNSLPELAELLYNPKRDSKTIKGETSKEVSAYWEETKEKCEGYCDTLDRAKEAFQEFHENSPHLAFLSSDLSSEFWEELRDILQEEDKNIREVVNKETAGYLAAIKVFLEVTRDPEKMKGIHKELECELGSLQGRLKNFKTIDDLKIDAEVELEHKLPKDENESQRQRIDVLLRDHKQQKYAIIELKQWTEDNIEVHKEIEETEDEDEIERWMVQAWPLPPQEHPAKKVKDYREKLRKEVGEDAKILSFVYLHNMYYLNSELFSAPDEIIYDYEATLMGQNRNAVIYTRMHSDSFRNRICDFFQSDKE